MKNTATALATSCTVGQLRGLLSSVLSSLSLKKSLCHSNPKLTQNLFFVNWLMKFCDFSLLSSDLQVECTVSTRKLSVTTVDCWVSYWVVLWILSLKTSLRKPNLNWDLFFYIKLLPLQNTACLLTQRSILSEFNYKVVTKFSRKLPLNKGRPQASAAASRLVSL